MAELSKPDTRYQTAKDAAEEAIEALLTVYWADSFDTELLLDRLSETILFFIRNARRLEEPHPYPDLLAEAAEQAIAPQLSSDPRNGASSPVQAS